MEFTFLGTAAGEQYPGFWCQCENCEKARRLGGKNIRKNCASWIEPNCLIDFPSEVFMQAERYDIDLLKTEILLVTHSHEDHLFPYLLKWRYMSADISLSQEIERKQLSAPRFNKLKTLKIYGNQSVYDKIKNMNNGNLKELALEINLVEPYKRYDLGEMRIIPLTANHPDEQGYGLNYIIEKEGKTILYALDTGWFLPETLVELKKYKYDMVVIEGTCGEGADNLNHMNFRHVKMAYEFFINNHLLKDQTKFFVTHLSPHWTPVHDEIAPVLESQGIKVSYDGLNVHV